MCCTRPVLTAHLFFPLLDNLISVLESLQSEDWDSPTSCPGWRVRDVASHLLGDDVTQLSMGRDDYKARLIDAYDWKGLVAGLNNLNDQWVEAMKRVSPRLMTDLLKWAGGQACENFQPLDPYSVGPVVRWASPQPAPMWLHIAREYTERWHHQQQIREAVGTSLLTDPDWFSPVLATFVYALPETFSGVSAAIGTTVQVTVSGASGLTCSVVRTESKWVLCDKESAESAARVTIDEVDAWKLFTKSITRCIVEPRVVFEGDQELGSKALDTVSIIA